MSETTKKFSGKYIESVGRRKTAIARVRIFPGSTGIIINDRSLTAYFPAVRLQSNINAPFKASGFDGKVGISVQVKGGGISAQSEAIRHGLSRALSKLEPELRSRLKKHGYLTRDPRMVERKKYGLKKARRSPQWGKR